MRRYKEALELIASGAENSISIAKEAIRDRKPPAKFWHKSKDGIAAFFESWVAAGKPSHQEFGKIHGISGSRVGQILWSHSRSNSGPSDG